MNARQEALLTAWWNDASDDEKGEVINEINSYNGAFEDEIWFEMFMFDEFMGYKPPIEIAEMVYNGDFCPDHNYWHFNSYGTLVSTNYPDYDDIDIDDVISELDSVPISSWHDYIKDIYDVEDLEYSEGDVVSVNGRKAEIDKVDIEDETLPYHVVYGENDEEWIVEDDIEDYWEDEEEDEEEEEG